MVAHWVEAVVPLVIIGTLVAGMGALPGGVQLLMTGKPKAVNADAWDRLTFARDARLTTKEASEQS